MFGSVMQCRLSFAQLAPDQIYNLWQVQGLSQVAVAWDNVVQLLVAVQVFKIVRRDEADLHLGVDGMQALKELKARQAVHPDVKQRHVINARLELGKRGLRVGERDCLKAVRLHSHL